MLYCDYVPSQPQSLKYFAAFRLLMTFVQCNWKRPVVGFAS